MWMDKGYSLPHRCCGSTRPSAMGTPLRAKNATTRMILCLALVKDSSQDGPF